jgi:adenosine deaminase
MLELARERSIPMPAITAGALARHMLVSDAASLEEYLERFDTTLSIMQDRPAIERIAYECVVDHALENVRHVEVRFCPLLNTTRGLAADEVLDAALAGMRRAEQEHDISTGVIVCGLRSHGVRDTLAMAELAVAYRKRGVCGFDIAGAEAGHPVVDHADAFDHAHGAALPITIHAGEGFGPASIRQALELGHARRIGHGTRLSEDPELLEIVRERQIPLEVCITSNVQTRVAASAATHPAGTYLEAGIPISLGTDNRLMSGVDLTGEYARAVEAFDLSQDKVLVLARTSFDQAFVSDDVRATLLERFDREVRGLGGPS